MTELRTIPAAAALTLLLLSAVPPAPFGSSAGMPDVPERLPADGGESWSAEVLAGLSLEAKVGQMFAARAEASFQGPSRSEADLQRLVDEFGVGSLVFFQTDPLAQAAMVNRLQRRSEVPLLISQDMEWGPGMRIRSATTFPRTMAIGAARNPEYAYAAGYVTAREARALGTVQVFAPVADINSNPNNPIINIRSYGERPELVEQMVVSFVRGLQDGGAIATVKHFPGHGDTATDSHADLPVLQFDRARLDEVELRPFRSAIEAGAMSVMTGHLAFPQLEPDTRIPATLSPNVTRELLRQELQFDGLVVTDAMNMASVTKYFGSAEAAVRAVEAGADIILLSNDMPDARNAIVKAVREGRIPVERVDESVARILKAKERLQLHEQRTVDLTDAPASVATPYHTMISETIARASITLLRNRNDLVPLGPEVKNIVTIVLTDEFDPGAAEVFTDHVRRFAPSAVQHVITLHRRSPRSELEAAMGLARAADVVLVPAIVHVRAWAGVIDLPARHRQLVNDLIATDVPVAMVSLGNPYIVRRLERQPDVYIAAYGASDASQKTVAQALFGRSAVSGRLPVTIPDLYAYGDGLPLEQHRPRRGHATEVGLAPDTLEQVDQIIADAIADRSFPGAAVAIGRPGVVAHLRGYGSFTYDSDRPVTSRSVFDLASLTKVVATTTSVMLLYDEGRIDLDAPVARYLPGFGRAGKEAVTVRQLLHHTGGLAAFRPYHTHGFERRDAVIEALFSEPLQYAPGSEVRYSDLGFITLGLLVETVSGETLSDFTRSRIFEPLGMRDTGFRGTTGLVDPTVVPTEVDTLWRGRLVQGEVHDETAYLLGGAAGHAGLFSTAEDLALFADMLLNQGRVGGRWFLRPETVKQFTTRRPDATRQHTRALGWDLKSPDGYSSAGRFFGPNSYGHTGFTGTSIWLDPDAGLYVILLTNRVYPTRANRKHIAVRPRVADTAFLAIAGPPAPMLPGSPDG